MTTLEYTGLEHQPDDGTRLGRLGRGIRRLLRAQFGCPQGLLGNVAGAIMARTRSNLDRIEWTLSLLEVGPRDRVLEVGFGPGVGIELLSKIATEGFVAGIDHSPEMVRHATKRNAEGIQRGRIFLSRASASEPPAFDKPFDKILTINSIHFWNDPVECLRKLRMQLRPGGLIAVTLQPRTHTATDATTTILGEEIAAKLKRAGFSRWEIKKRKTATVPVACVLATN